MQTTKGIGAEKCSHTTNLAAKKTRDESPYDWAMIFETLHKIKDEIKEFFPYPVVQIDGAEADDIIGTLCMKNGSQGLRTFNTEKILILSSDKDFMQLQKFVNVEQYSPMQKRFVKPEFGAQGSICCG